MKGILQRVAVSLKPRDPRRQLTSVSDCHLNHIRFTHTCSRRLPNRLHPQAPRCYHQSAHQLPAEITNPEHDFDSDTRQMSATRSTSATSSGEKRKRATPAFYAVKKGRIPAIYMSWDDAKAQIEGFTNSIHRKFNTLSEAEAFMASTSNSATKPGKTKYYGVQRGHKPGVYTDWPTAQAQITKFSGGGKQKAFATEAEAKAFVDEGKKSRDTSAPISLRGDLTCTPESSTVCTAKGCKVSDNNVAKKQKKNDGSARNVIINGDLKFEPGTGPLPPDAEDGFDRNIKFNPDTGSIQEKDENELNAMKMQPTGEFSGPLEIHTDGASKGNGTVGAFAGVGVYFGPRDLRNVSDPLIGDRQTNQRAELTAVQRALDIAPLDRDVILFTDSYYSMKACTEWFKTWKDNNWKTGSGKPVENRDIIEPITARLYERGQTGATTKILWEKAHCGNPGNEMADRLANEGARKCKIQKENERLNVEKGAWDDAVGAVSTEVADDIETNTATTVTEDAGDVYLAEDASYAATQLAGAGAKEGQEQLLNVIDGVAPSLESDVKIEP